MHCLGCVAHILLFLFLTCSHVELKYNLQFPLWNLVPVPDVLCRQNMYMRGYYGLILNFNPGVLKLAYAERLDRFTASSQTARFS